MAIPRRTKDQQQLMTLILVAVVVVLLLGPSVWHPFYARPDVPEGYLDRHAVHSDVQLPMQRAERDTSTNYAGSSRWYQHGLLGRRADGVSYFQYAAHPGVAHDMKAELDEHGFRVALSDAISLDRNATDNRHPQCHEQDENTTGFDILPQTSVVFVFYNEALSTLLRSIHSVLNRSPPELLKEIILIDDGSDKTHLKEPLEQYIARLPKVRLIRQDTRKGLVQARLKGAEMATAETFTVLDSHIEVQEGWLPPLMRRMHKHPERVLMPMIDSINPETFDFNKGGIGCTLGFLWGLTEHSIPVQPKDQPATPTDYIRSPAMAGGLFTCNRDFFWELGGYDTDFSFWGTENLEFSFRLWQCGGTLECSPCSRVYHIFRNHHPYTLPPNSITRNKLRTAAIWMDEYAPIVQTALGNPEMDIGPLDHMLALRKRLECKPFSWYMKEVYPTNIFSDMSELHALGDIKNKGTNQCLDSLWHEQPGQSYGIYGCHGQGGTQAFALLKSTKRICPLSNLDVCLLPSLVLGTCDGEAARWEYTTEGYLLHSDTNKCLVVDDSAGRLQLQMSSCGTKDAHLEWEVHVLEQPQALGNLLDGEREQYGETADKPVGMTATAAKRAKKTHAKGAKKATGRKVPKRTLKQGQKDPVRIKHKTKKQ
eukprot:m.280150 g.280150  ORF g.280150 m.280150 type:complete len:652 (+) comp19820_c0_seq9:134-2089(+)